MYPRLILTLTAFSLVSGPAFAQMRRAAITGGGNFDRGNCTIEVVVDGAADVEIRGDTAILRNFSGQPPQWRRFECTGVMPPNPAGFRLAGVDGRGRQQLLRDPREGGTAVVRIEDPDHGAEGYTFDIMWGGGGGYPDIRQCRALTFIAIRASTMFIIGSGTRGSEARTGEGISSSACGRSEHVEAATVTINTGWPERKWSWMSSRTSYPPAATMSGNWTK